MKQQILEGQLAVERQHNVKLINEVERLEKANRLFAVQLTEAQATISRQGQQLTILQLELDKLQPVNGKPNGYVEPVRHPLVQLAIDLNRPLTSADIKAAEIQAYERSNEMVLKAA